MKHLSVGRLEYLKKEPSEVYAQELKTMIEVCLFHHPDKFMDGFEGEDLDKEKRDVPAV